MVDDPDMTAAELALGVLDAEERAAALRRVLADPAFAREVAQWRARLTPLYGAFPDAEPGADVARRIQGIPDGGGVSARPWRWATAAATLTAAVLAGLLLVRPDPAAVPAPAPVIRPATPPLVAVLKPVSGEPFGAIWDPATREMRWSAALAVPAARVAELWTIGADGVPHAAGLLPEGANGRLVLARDVEVASGMTLAISIEPEGGSPRPTPTGPVIATGVLSLI